MQSVKSKTAGKLSIATPHWQLTKAILVIPQGNADTKRLFSHSQQNEAQKQTRNFYIKFTFNSVIQCSSKML